MTATAFELRNPNYHSFTLAAPSPGVTAGVPVALSNGVVGVPVETKATAENVTFIYKAQKIVVAKPSGAIALGAKVYYNGSGQVTATSATGRRYCGICTKAAESADTSVEIDLDGTLGITAQTS